MSDRPHNWRLEDDCFVHDRDRLTYEQAIAILRSRLKPLADIETILLENASGRILQDTAKAPRPIPAFDNSAVDGYAIAFRDLSDGANAQTQLSVSSRIPAGAQAVMPKLATGTAARIFTGGVLPEGADTVVMQEDCRTTETEDVVLIPAGLKKGSNIRRAGEDLQVGAPLTGLHERLRPADIARLASAGVHQVQVFGELRVAVISNGNELRQPGEALPPGAVFDANSKLLTSLAKHLPVETVFLGIMPDDYEQVKELIAEAARDFDVIITSGGASKGDADHLQAVLNDLGKSHMWQLAIKPGRPMMMGQIGQTPIFALPGNPVAVFICWCLFVHPSLLRLGGANWPTPQRITVPSGFEISKKKPDRREFYRGWLETHDGITQGVKFDRDGSGLIAGLQAATGLLEIPEEATSVAVGELINYWPLSQFGAD
ncbi:MAG: gephyrin-like molybdotransferase Glp [Pseudomonadota bacterium]